MPGPTCPECGLVHPPVPPGQPCPVAQAQKSFNLYDKIRQPMSKVFRLTEKFPSQREKIALRFRELLEEAVKKLEEEFDASSD